MKNDVYKRFKKGVIEADEKDPIWWLGYLWIDLTVRQAKEVIGLLSEKPFIKEVVTFNGHEAYEIPSGLQIWKEQGK